MYLTSNTFMEIFVRYFPILITVEFVKDEVKLIISQEETPMLKVELQFISLNETTLSLVQIDKGFSYSLPLKFYLIKDLLFQVFIYKGLAAVVLYLFKITLVGYIILILRVLYRIMSKVEALTLMDRVTNPFGEI